MIEDADQVPAQDDPFMHTGIQYYLFAGFAGLLAAWFMLQGRFGTIPSLIPAVLGAMGMAGYAIPPNMGRMTRALRRPSQMMPLLVLGAVVVLTVLFETSSRGNAESFDMDDALMAAGVLTYLASQYRLFSLGSAAFPPDSRPRTGGEAGDEPEQRPTSLATPMELAWLGLTLLASIALGLLIWYLTIVDWTVVGPKPAQLDPARTGWRYILLIWLLGMGTLVLIGVFHTLRNYRMSEDESRMVLQDSIWSETRGEQRRVNRWIAWQQRRLQRKRESQA
jgi:hypothetical protein